MLILIDGYNVTMHDPALAGRTKEAQRDALVQRARHIVPREHGRAARAVVVFDARDSPAATSERRPGVETVYARDADDEIVARCARGKGAIVVYSNDMRLRMRISQDVRRTVEYRDVSALFAGAGRGSRGAAERSGAEEDPAAYEPPPRDAADITAELEELWTADEGE